VEKTGVPRENYRPVTSHWQILSHNVVSIRITGESQPDGFNDEQCTAIVLNSIHNEKNWNDVPCVAMGSHLY
jgi:hypothetical protein